MRWLVLLLVGSAAAEPQAPVETADLTATCRPPACTWKVVKVSGRGPVKSAKILRQLTDGKRVIRLALQRASGWVVTAPLQTAAVADKVKVGVLVQDATTAHLSWSVSSVWTDAEKGVHGTRLARYYLNVDVNSGRGKPMLTSTDESTEHIE